MGISRDSRHKRRLTGGFMPVHQKKRAFEKARPIANTRLISGHEQRRIRSIRVRGGNYKYRALRLNEGNFSWGSQGVTRKTKIVDIVYNASNNELVRTKTLVKNCIVQIDATPFKEFYVRRYGEDLSKKKNVEATVTKRSKHATKVFNKRVTNNFIDESVKDQFPQQRVLACISSRPGQSGRADGYILEGTELQFYIKKIEQKKK